MFGRLRERLLRTKWATPQLLAEELYTMFSPDQELTHEGPINLIRRGNDPFFFLRGGFDGQPVFNFLGRSGQSLGNISFSNGEFDNLARPNPTTSGSAGTSTFPAKIVSGAVASYVLDTYPAGVNGTVKRVSATLLNPTTNVVLPAGLWTMVSKVAGVHYFQIDAPATVPAKVISNSGSTYQMKAYFNGLAGDTVVLEAAWLNPDATIPFPADYWLNLIRKLDNSGWVFLANVPGTFPGTVLSGSGSTYQMTIFPFGLSLTSYTVSATQLQIDAADTIPVGTKAMVSKMHDGSFVFQVPVWLE